MYLMKNNFLWGAASAAYQIEGAYQEDGKGISIWDTYANSPGNTYMDTNGNIACDHYHRYSEDIQLMKEMGLKTYRFSISWTRILPMGKGAVNEKGIRFYRNLCRELVKNGIEPMVTLYHWDLPEALQKEYGGWESEKITDDFVYYAQICFEALNEYVNYWIVMNEPNIFTQMGYLTQMHPPKKSSLPLYLKAFHHTVLAHAKTVLKYKELGFHGKIGSSIAFTPSYAASESAQDLAALDMFRATTSDWYLQSYYKGSYPAKAIEYYRSIGLDFMPSKHDLEIMKKACQFTDFIGINYYQTARIAYNPIGGVGMSEMNTTGQKGSQKESGIPGLYKQVSDPSLKYTDWDWAIDPKGLTRGLSELYKTYRLPILISENGLGAYDQIEEGAVHDSYRIDYLKEHIKALQAAEDEGVDVLGYCVWSFCDLLSWLNGYQKRYGLVYVDFDNDLRRIKKDSFMWYKKVIRTNGEI